MAHVPAELLAHRLERFERTCRAQGLKLTHQRLEIYREVAGTDEHPDVDTVYQRVRRRLPTVSLDTVYRTLTTLAEIGVIREVSVSGPRHRYDANAEPHHHCICTRCRRIADFGAAAPELASLPAEATAFGRLERVQLQVLGVCQSCLAEDGRASPPPSSPANPNP